MYLNSIAVFLQLATVVTGPAIAQTAIEQQRQDVISSIVQIQDELALRNARQVNNARIDQNGNSNETVITQNGNQNVASVAISGDGNGLREDGASANISQNGILNFTAVEVRGNDNLFGIDQTGTANAAVLFQSGGSATHGSNVAQISQFQDGNVVSVVQQSIYANLFPGRSDNVFSAVQNGQQNSAFAEQFGAANDGAIEQTGDGNSAVLGQYGASNSSLISQTGNGLTAQSLQFGDFTDPITITQTPGAPPVFVTRSAQ